MKQKTITNITEAHDKLSTLYKTIKGFEEDDFTLELELGSMPTKLPNVPEASGQYDDFIAETEGAKNSFIKQINSLHRDFRGNLLSIFEDIFWEYFPLGSPIRPVDPFKIMPWVEEIMPKLDYAMELIKLHQDKSPPSAVFPQGPKQGWSSDAIEFMQQYMKSLIKVQLNYVNLLEVEFEYVLTKLGYDLSNDQ